MHKLRFAHIFSFTLLSLLFLLVDTASSQIYNRTGSDKSIVDNQKIISDSARGFAEKGLDYAVDIYFINHKGERKNVDTSITGIHKHDFLSDGDVSLGNLGSAYQSLQASAELPIAYTLLPQAWDAYRFTPEALKFYNTTKPFSLVRYVAGSKQEQVLELFHTQNINPLWNFSATYRKINSLGFYNAQKNNIDNFSFTSGYKSLNQRYSAQGGFVYNKLQQDENLGLLSDSFLTESQFRNHSLIPVGVNVASNVTRSPIVNYRRDANVRFKQEYSIGKTSITYDADSLKQTTFKPILTFGNEVYYTAERYCFRNGQPDAAFQTNYLNNAFNLTDTLTIRYDNNTIGTNVSAEGNVYLNEKIFTVIGGLGFEYQKIGGWAATRTAVNNYVFGELTNRKSKDSSWKLEANMKLYYTGLAKGNLRLTANLSKALPRNLGEIGVRVGQYIQQPFYVSESIQVNNIEKRTELKSQINTVLGGYYINKPLQFKASVNSLLFNQLIYSSGYEPNYQNYSAAIGIQQIQLEKGFSFGHWNSTNRLLVQIKPNNTPINIPLLSTYHRLAFNDYLFKGKLEVSTGFDVYFNTPYYNDIYQPVFQSFNPQNSLKYQFIPRINPFFNFRVKRFRASVSLDQMQHFFVKNNLNYVNYAAQNQLVRFGLRWIFIN